MAAAAEDVARLVREQLGPEPPGALLGHSMGGKVALALLDRLQGAAGAQGGAGAATGEGEGEGSLCALPRQVWVLDSQPGLVGAEADAGTGVSRVLQAVQTMPMPAPSRAAVLSQLRASGLSEPLAQWLGSNLVPHHAEHQHGVHRAGEDAQHGQHGAQHGVQHHHAGQPRTHGPAAAAHTAAAAAQHPPVTWSFDTQGAGAMYVSYRTTEFWRLLEAPPPGTALHLVQGQRSDRWPPDLQRRLEEAASKAAAAAPVGPTHGSQATRGSFSHHVLPRAGHWLHVDNPGGLADLILPRLAGV